MQIMPMTSEKMRSDFRNYSFTNFLVIIALGKNKYLRHKYPKSKRKKGRNVIIFCSMLPTNPCPLIPYSFLSIQAVGRWIVGNVSRPAMPCSIFFLLTLLQKTTIVPSRSHTKTTVSSFGNLPAIRSQ